MVPLSAYFRIDAIGPIGALINPCAQDANLLAREAVAFLGHDQIGFQSADELNHQALRAFAGDYSRTGGPAFRAVCLTSIAVRFSASAGRGIRTVLGKDRLDVFNEINLGGGRRRQLAKVRRGRERGQGATTRRAASKTI